MKIKTANGTIGCLIYSHSRSTFLFRKYNDDHTFTDYDIQHCDLGIQITDEDSAFYYDNGKCILDHSPETLGIDYEPKTPDPIG